MVFTVSFSSSAYSRRTTFRVKGKRLFPRLFAEPFVKIEAYIHRVPLLEPFRIATGVSLESRTILIRLLDGELEGWGEACPSRNVLGETLEDSVESLRRAARLIAESDYSSLERIYEFVSSLEATSSVKAAVDMALLDLYAKSLGKPLWRVLGGYRDEVETDITIGIMEPSEMAERAARYVERGFRILKLKLGEDPEKDIERVKAVRDAVGEGVRIRVDANQGWSVEQALRTIDRIASYEVELVEQPTRWDDLEGLAEIRAESPLPIALDETVKTPEDALTVIRAEAADIVNIKLMKSQGILGAVRIASICEAAGVENMIGCFGESRVGMTAAVHFSQAIRNVKYYDLDCDLLVAESLVTGGASIDKGVRKTPEEPGLGRFSFRWDRLTRIL